MPGSGTPHRSATPNSPRMTLAEFLAAADALAREGVVLIERSGAPEQLDEERSALVGRASGRLGTLMRMLPQLPAAERREAGAAANRTKALLEETLARRRGELAAAAPAAPALDLTMPARRQWVGARHPVTLVMDEVEEIFRELGFTVAMGPEIETEWYNFHALNFPPDHPALDMHDTLYLESAPGGDALLLRTHTSPVQVRTLQAYRPPVRVLIPGTVHRRDFFDSSHAPSFAQVEGLAVDEGVSFVDLKATLTHFARRFFGATRTRFRPSYFPFTEPSAEMDVQCSICAGRGCAGCKGTGWMEILGAGLVHPAVLEAAGLDAQRYSGWAFGMGPARIAMQRYGVEDIRTLYDADVRFLEQFAR